MLKIVSSSILEECRITAATTAATVSASEIAERGTGVGIEIAAEEEEETGIGAAVEATGWNRHSFWNDFSYVFAGFREIRSFSEIGKVVVVTIFYHLVGFR